MKLGGVLETSLYVDDLDAAERFYADVLGLDRISKQPGRHVFFRCGDSVLLLFDPRSTRVVAGEVDGQPIPAHGAQGAGHVAFRVTLEEIGSWRERLERCGVAIESEVDWPGGGRSFYFRDPAGNSLEIASPELWEP